MAHALFEQDIFIAASPTIVRDLLAKLNNLAEMHPFIVKTQLVKTETAPDGTKVEYYRIRDRMKLGPFTVQFTYRANTSINVAGEFVSDAYQSPGIHLHNITTCYPEGDGARVKEHIEITAPRLLMNITYNGAQTSHKEMLENLKKTAETTQKGI